MFVVSCNGQDKSVDQKEAKSKSDIKEEIAFSMFMDQDQKINQVVRTLFQDSKGAIWFGTESGAFKLVGDSLIYLSDILCESGKRVTIKAFAEDLYAILEGFIEETQDAKIVIGKIESEISQLKNDEVQTNDNSLLP